MFDSTGPLDLAFYGGLNAPRPQLVDADGDGDLDLFVQEVTGSVALFERLSPAGRGAEPEGLPRFRFRGSRYAGLDVGEWYRFADVDQDGDLDLLAEQPYSYIKYFRNDGRSPSLSERGPTHRFVLAADTLKDTDGQPIFSDRQNIPQLGDLDCNRRSDLLIGRLDGTVARYEAEPGDGPAPAFRLVAQEFEGIKIVGQQGTTPGQMDPGAFRPGPSMHGANTMALADHDLDGDLDLFWGDFFEPGLLLLENTGSCPTPSFRGSPVQFPPGKPVLTSGYNAPTFGEGKTGVPGELVLGVLGGAFNPLRTSAENLFYMRRTAQGWTLLSRRLLPMLDIGSEAVPAVVDLDRDGDLDLLLANKLDPGDLKTSRLYFIENTGSTTRPSFTFRKPVALPPRYHYAPAFGDLDADGRPDLVLGHWGAQLGWFRGTDTGFEPVDTAFVTITRGSNTTPTLGDLDGDGDLDLVIGESSGWLNYYRNVGSKERPRFALVSDEFDGIKVGRRSAPLLVDLDADRDLDLIVGSELDGLVIFRNLGTAAAPRFERDRSPMPEVPALSVPAAGDFDGDGDLDLVVGNVGGGMVYLQAE